MFNLLTKPYPYLFTLKRNLLVAGSIGLLAIFLNSRRINDSFFFHNTILQPVYVSVLTGLIVALSIFLMLHVFPHYFISEDRIDRWNIANELLLSLGVFVAVFVFNYLFFITITKDNSQLLSLPFFLKLGGRVITTGMVVLSSVLWVNYTITLKRNLKHVELNNERLEEQLTIRENKNKKSKDSQIITLESDLKNEVIRFNINDLLFIKSDGNYVEVYTQNENKVVLKLYRASLQMLEDKLSGYDQIVRTHRSFLVNIHRIKQSTGNARNYQLIFDGTDIQVPVSRNRFSVFNEAVSSLEVELERT